MKVEAIGSAGDYSTQIYNYYYQRKVRNNSMLSAEISNVGKTQTVGLKETIEDAHKVIQRNGRIAGEYNKLAAAFREKVQFYDKAGLSGSYDVVMMDERA